MNYLALISTLALGACSCFTVPANEAGHVRTQGENSAQAQAPTPGNPEPDRPSSEDRGQKGNASANNGKGGNYDKTGHSDNGKGQGRNR